jgi:HEAT repeat protein
MVLNYLLDIAPAMGPALAKSLNHDSADVRRLVADMLGFSRDLAVVPMLEAATKDPDPDVAAAAQQAIARLKL